MFKRFNRLVSSINFKQNTLSLYGDAMAYTFFNKKFKFPYKSNLKKSNEENYIVKDKMPKIIKIKNTL